MFLVATRNFPPEVGGMQNLMEGLSNALLNHGPVKVFAENYDQAEEYDQNSKLEIERISGFKLFRKYRKANRIKEFMESNEIRAAFFDHWKSIENIESSVLKKTKSFCLIHSKEINHPVGSSLNKRVLKSLSKADHVIANSRFTKELALKLGVKDVTVINPGCNYPIPVNDEAKEYANKLVFLMGVDKARFRNPVIPDCELHLEIEAIRSHGRVWKYKGTAKVDGMRMADAEWSATIVDRKT